MKFRSAVPGLAFLRWCGWFPFFFHKSKRAPVFCLMAGLLPALLVPTAVAQSSTNIPIFQFAIFYNVNMEIDPGAPMAVNGPVFSNAGLWSGTPYITYNSTVAAVGQVNTTATDPFATGKTDSGTPAGNFTLSGQPVSGVSPISLLIFGTNNLKAMLNLPPVAYALGTTAAYSTNGQAYLANAVDLYITNSVRGTNFGSLIPSGTNTIIYFQDSLAVPPLTRITNDFYLLTNRVTHTIFSTNNVTSNQLTNLWYAGYSFVTNVVFYDWREGWNGGSGPAKKVEAVQIDIAKFNIWRTNAAVNGGNLYNTQNIVHKGHPIDSVYVYDSVPLNGTTLPAVRLVNGQQLPSSYGFTLATPFPLYVYGNYNVSNNLGSSLGQNSTIYTWPAALMADAVTILSTNWSDAVITKLPSSGNTTVNAAMLTGIVPSDPTISGDYSGGVENYLRLLENWSGLTLTYNGSIVVMFPSQYATNHWRPTGNYYNAPIRHWAFDTNFLNPAKLPPLTPMVWNYTNPPVITTQPQSQTIPSGNNATFGVAANGSGSLSYQWSFNGTNLARATNTSLTLTNVQFNQAGNYAVLVTNAFGSTLSSNAVLTVTATRPTIQAQPTNQSIFVNGTATFGVTAAGSLPLSYQWSFNGTDIDGATNASFTLANVQTNQAGNYAVQVTNPVGSTNSTSAVLTVVGLPPAITVQPTNQTVTVGYTANFNVTATGSLPLNYQWSFNGTDIDGATSASLVLTDVQTGQSGGYTVQVTNAFGSIMSSNAILTVTALPPVVLTQPTNQTLPVGYTATFNVTATGSLPLNYQWSFNGTNIDGATSASLVLTNVQTNQSGVYAAKVTNAFGSIVSSNANLNAVPLPPTILAQPISQMVLQGGIAGLNVTVTGSLPLNYQWSFNGTNINGATNASITFASVQSTQAGNYSVVVTNAYGSEFSSNVFLITVKPSSLSVDQTTEGGLLFSYFGLGNESGQSFTPASSSVGYFQMNVISLGMVVQVNLRSNSFTGPILGSTYPMFVPNNYPGDNNITLFFPTSVPVTPGTTYYAEIIVQSGRGWDIAASAYGYEGGSMMSNPSEDLYFQEGIVMSAPLISSQPASCTNIAGTTVNFTATVFGTAPLNYQWQFNGTNLVDATNTTLTLNNVTTNQAGAYSVTVTNMIGSVTSSNAVLSVYATAAAMLNGCSFSRVNGLKFQVAGVPGFNYAVQESTNLIDWVSLITNTSPFIFVDANATNFPQQFYRTLFVP